MPAKGIFGQWGMHDDEVLSLACGSQNPFSQGKVITSLIMDKVDNVCEPGKQKNETHVEADRKE